MWKKKQKCLKTFFNLVQGIVFFQVYLLSHRSQLKQKPASGANQKEPPSSTPVSPGQQATGFPYMLTSPCRVSFLRYNWPCLDFSGLGSVREI